MGFVVSAIVVGGGLLWIFIRSLRGKDVDRRIVFGFVGITVALAVLFQLKFGEVATPIVKTLFEKIETLPPGSKIVISFDFDPAMAPEVLPMANSFTRHALAKGHRIYFFSIWATGQSLLQVTLHDIVEKEFPDAVYGIDYVNMGYKAGNEGVLNVIITDIRKMYPGDVNGTSLDSIPMMKDVHSLKDMDLLLVDRWRQTRCQRMGVVRRRSRQYPHRWRCSGSFDTIAISLLSKAIGRPTRRNKGRRRV